MGAGPKASSHAPYLESNSDILFLPSIVVYDVHKKLVCEQGKHMAETFLSEAFGFGDRLIPLSLDLSILASRMSIQTGFWMADAIVYATAHHCKAQLIPPDSQFANLDPVTLPCGKCRTA